MARAGTGVFLDLPKLTTTFSTLSHVNAACETANTSSSTANKALDFVYDTLTHIDASVDIGLGVTAQAEVDFGDYSFVDNAPYTVLSKGFALPTACISFDVAKKAFGVPSATTTKGGTAGGAPNTAGHASGASVEAYNPFGRHTGISGRRWLMMPLLGIVSACFALL